MKVAKIGDIIVGVCPCHPVPIPYTALIISGSFTSSFMYMDNARIGDIGVCSCGHVTVIITGSGIATMDYRPTSRIGDVAVCPPGVVVTGSNMFDSE